MSMYPNFAVYIFSTSDVLEAIPDLDAYTKARGWFTAIISEAYTYLYISIYIYLNVYVYYAYANVSVYIYVKYKYIYIYM